MNELYKTTGHRFNHPHAPRSVFRWPIIYPAKHLPRPNTHRHRANLKPAAGGVGAHLLVVLGALVHTVDDDEVEEAVVHSLPEDLLEGGAVGVLQASVKLIVHHLQGSGQVRSGHVRSLSTPENGGTRASMTRYHVRVIR